MNLFSAPLPELASNALAARRGVFLGVCLAVATAWAPSEVEASCGDWLAHPSAMPQQAGQDAERGSEAQEQTSDWPAPCRGPQCERSPYTPAPPAPAGFPTASKDIGCLIAGAVSAKADARSSMLAEAHLVLPDGHPKRIDRPPRPLS